MTHDNDLTGAVALVTGAAGVLGQSICEALRRNGATVLGADIKPGADDLLLDVTDTNSWAIIIQHIKATHGRLDILVNNAGVAPMQKIEEITLDTWRRTMAINVESVVLSIQAATPILRHSGTLRRGGASVINIASAAANRTTPFSAAYSTSKAAMAMLTKCIAIEYSVLEYPIRVNSVHPGAVRSVMMSDIVQSFSDMNSVPTAQLEQAILANCPMKRLVEPEEVAAAVVYLSSTAASFLQGTEQHVDGGYSIA